MLSFKNFKHYLYLLLLRYKINKINCVEDIIDLVKNITLYKKNITTDQLINILIECFKIYPLTEKELQTLSTLQQIHENDLDIKNYVTFIIWISTIHYIDETNDQLKLDVNSITAIIPKTNPK